MYRLIILTSLFIAAECCFPKYPKSPCHWAEGRAQFEQEARVYFEEIAKYLHDIDRIANAFCYMFGENEMQVHGDTYKLIVAAPAGTGPYKVSLRHTVLFIQGSGTGCNSLSHMKILPPYVDVSKLTWKYKDNAIVVSVPFSRTVTGYKKCPFTAATFDAVQYNASKHHSENIIPVYIEETKV